MSAEKYVIGLDSGTSACKVIIVDCYGNIKGAGKKPHKTYSPKPNLFEQNPRDWWTKFREALKEAILNAKISPKEIIALGVTNQRSTIVPVDEKGKELRPAICWMDSRPSPKFKWIKENEAEIWNKTFKIVDVQAWFIYKLTGEWKGSKASPIVVTSNWNWDEELIKSGEVSKEKLPEYLYPGEIAGKITKKVAVELGLPEDLPVVCGCGDKQAGIIGAACLDPQKLMVSYGTSLSLGTTSDRIATPPIITGLSGIPLKYSVEMGMSSGLWIAQWFQSKFCRFPFKSYNFLSVREKELDMMAGKLGVGSEGLLVLPYWLGPDWSQKDSTGRGIVLGWMGSHTLIHFYRALIEGVVFEARCCKEILEDRLKTVFTDIRIVGGGATSNLIMQITADVFNQCVKKIQTPSAEALGAAVLAAKGVKIFNSVEEAARSMVKIAKKVKPKGKNVLNYERIYLEKYLPARKIYLSKLRHFM
ncbi:MAG: FGGY family carbohydrate kinase [Candidatus Bathyarchaeia archaeon]